MKKTIAILSVFIKISAYGQIPTDPATNKFIYESVVSVDTVKSDVIYHNAKEWVSRNLKSSDSNINFDKDTKTIITTGNIHLENRAGLCAHQDINLNFKFSVFAKDGRYKYIIENFYVSYYNVCGEGLNTPVSGSFEDLNFGKKQKVKVFEEADMKIKGLISDLEKSITNSQESKKSDW